MDKDIRWEQRFSNYRKALRKLKEAVVHIQNESARLESDCNEGLLRENEVRIEDEMLMESLIKRFEFTHELAWKVMKDYLEFQGIFDAKGPKDVTQRAFSLGLITDGGIWMDMIKSRNLTVYTYDEETVEEVFGNIMNRYYSLFLSFETKMSEYTSSRQTELF